MAKSRTLLERLADPRGESERTTRVDGDAIAESVLTHLHRLLNTRRGSALSAPEYGVPEFSELVHSFPDAIVDLQRAIKGCIERYEPRLLEVVVTHVPTPDNLLMLRFQITARLQHDGRKQPVWFETTIDSAGKATVKR
jgi:type VI secretion system protein